EYFEPVRPGDRITVTARIADIYEKRGRVGNMLFFVREIEYVNQFGELAARRRSTGIFYDATKSPD
ncbi:MAG: MaoC family dehydratase N-terminal domain-containing protein, partial [Chloroflexi bacterium]|nr:MaoC family dehydratase N-terminal domain-containing protein [Chloroflexota bacterium]